MVRDIRFHRPDIWIYYLAIRLYFFAAGIGSLFSKKHKLFIEGRIETRRKLSTFQSNGKPVIWFHCASLGEFEQARPLIEQIKKDYPFKHFIALSFFSPSGYEVRKNYALADFVFYLPMDTPSSARHLIDVLRPSMVFWIKNEFWLFTLRALFKRKVPTYLVASGVRKNQIFFKPHGRIFRAILHGFTHIFEQTDYGVQLLSSIGVRHVKQTYDTRFDRVFMNSVHQNPHPYLIAFAKNSRVFVAGSTWSKDEQIISSALKNGLFKSFKLIVAPHEIEESRIEDFIKQIPESAIRFSRINESTDLTKYQILILDGFGQLASAYKLAAAAYVGGGFGHSVHNVLEPAVYGIPVIFGPNYSRSSEAIELTKRHAAYPFRSAQEFESIMGDISRLSIYYSSSKRASQYVAERLGGTQAILHQAEAEHCL